MLGHFNCTLPLLGNHDSNVVIFPTACYQCWEILILILGFLPLLKKLDSNDVIFQTICYHYQEIRIPVLKYEILVIMLGFHHYWKITFQCWDISNGTSTLSGNSDLMLGYFKLYAIIILENYDSKLGYF